MPLHSTRPNKRILIIEAAARVFSQKGYAGTLIAEIARTAGIGKGTVYEYFNSKEDLFFAVFEWYVAQTSSEITVSLSALSGPVSDRLIAFGDGLLQPGIDLIEAFGLVMEFWAASASSQSRQRFKETFRKLYREFRGPLAALIREGIERGEFNPDIDPEPIAAALVGTWDAMMLQKWFEKEFDVLYVAHTFLQVVIRGLQQKGAEPFEDPA